MLEGESAFCSLRTRRGFNRKRHSCRSGSILVPLSGVAPLPQASREQSVLLHNLRCAATTLAVRGVCHRRRNDDSSLQGAMGVVVLRCRGLR